MITFQVLTLLMLVVSPQVSFREILIVCSSIILALFGKEAVNVVSQPIGDKNVLPYMHMVLANFLRTGIRPRWTSAWQG